MGLKMPDAQSNTHQAHNSHYEKPQSCSAKLGA